MKYTTEEIKKISFGLLDYLTPKKIIKCGGCYDTGLIPVNRHDAVDWEFCDCGAIPINNAKKIWLDRH